MPISEEIGLSLQILGNGLTVAKAAVYSVERGINWGDSSLLVWSMQSKGWRPNVVYMLRRITLVDFCYCVSCLDPPQGRDHSGCSEGVCSASQIDETTYQTRHA